MASCLQNRPKVGHREAFFQVDGLLSWSAVPQLITRKSEAPEQWRKGGRTPESNLWLLFKEKRMFFFFGGVIWLPGVYIICSNRYMLYYVMYESVFDVFWIFVSLWMQHQESGILFFPCRCSRNETRATLDYIIIFFASYIRPHTGWFIEIPTIIYYNTCNEGQSHPFYISKEPVFFSLLIWYHRRDVTRIWRYCW